MIVLAGGGWWVMKSRRDAAERARIESTVRMKQAEDKVRRESLEKEVAAAERALAELKGDLRNTRDLAPADLAELQARYRAQQDYSEWLAPYVEKHPSKALLAKLEALLSVKALGEARNTEAELSAGLAQAEPEIAERKKALLTLSAPLAIVSEPAGLSYKLTDAYGRVSEGKTPATVQAPLGRAEVVVQPPGAGWASAKRELRLERGISGEAKAVFGLGRVQLDSVPAGLDFKLTNPQGLARQGKTPVEFADLPVGPATVRISRPGWPDRDAEIEIKSDGSPKILAEFASGVAKVDSIPGSLAFVLTDSLGKKHSGTTPQAIEDLPPGPVQVEVSRRNFAAVTLKGTVIEGKTVPLKAELVSKTFIIGAEADVAIWVDGKLEGKGEVALQDRTPGVHPIELRRQGFPAYKAHVKIDQAAGTSALRFSFDKLAAQDIKCTRCDGKGKVKDSEACNFCSWGKVDCQFCDGQGKVPTPDSGGVRIRVCNRGCTKGKVDCRQCGGSGRHYFWVSCGQCSGDGYQSQLELAQK